MVDVHSPKVRSKNMRAIKSKDTTPELLVRRHLYQRGFRYRLHRRDLPGRPDITLTKYQAVIFVNGCFWHGHDCKFFKLPKTNTPFWNEKITATRERDKKNITLLRSVNWRIFIIWECELRGVDKSKIAKKMDLLASRIRKV